MRATASSPTGRDQGGVLVLVLIAAVFTLGIAVTYLTRGFREAQAGAGYTARSRARQDAESLLAIGRAMLRTMPVDPEGRNQLVADCLVSPEIRRLADGTPAVNEISGGTYHRLFADGRGVVWLSRLDGEYLRLDAEATRGSETVWLSATIVERVGVFSCQRVVPALGAYPGVEAVASGVDPFGTGDVLTVSPPPTTLPDVTALSRVASIPALPPLGTPPTDPVNPTWIYDIRLPGDATFSRLWSEASPTYRFTAPSTSYVVEFQGENLFIEAFPSGIPGPGIVTNLPTPTEGVLYFQGDILSLRGDVLGRLTLASEGTVHITGSIQYVDEDGRTAMLNGLNPGPEFTPNPDYTGNSVLGVVARGSIYYAPAMPAIAEVDAALYSQTGTVGLEMLWIHPTDGLNMSGRGVPIYTWSYTARGKVSLKELGAKVTNGIPCSAVQCTDLGFASVVSVYDDRLIDQPPPASPYLAFTDLMSLRWTGSAEALVAGADLLKTRRAGDAIPRVADEDFVDRIRAAVRTAAPTFSVTLGGE